MLRASLPSTLEIRERIGSDLPTVFADPTAIHQIMMNRFTNAAHTMEEEGGILKVDLTDFITKEPGQGTGLGLAVVHGLVQDYGGEIIVESAEGRGSSFDVYIPGMVETAAEDRESAEQSPDHGQGRVLFVDDKALIATLGECMPRRLGFERTASTDPVEALDRCCADSEAVDLLITDMTMPRMRGEERVKAMLAIREDLPVMLCTGFSQRISEAAARAPGIRAFVMKPLSMGELGNTLKEVLEGAA